MSNHQVFIKIETPSEQQENMKNSRKSLKVLQNVATDKENLVGRPSIKGKGGFTKSKSDVDFKFGTGDLLKRKKIDTKNVCTQTEACLTKTSEKVVDITAKDLTTEGNPGERYWEILAEKRRLALDETLDENRNLHDRIYGLESELETSQKMLDEAKNLVEVLTEMLEESEAKAVETTIDTDLVNFGASTSHTDESKYFDADSSLSPTKMKHHLTNPSDDDADD